MRQLNTNAKPNVNRKRATALWKKPAFRPLAFASLMGVVAALMTYAVKTGLADLATLRVETAAIDATAGSGFILKDVLVEGRENTPAKDLRAVVNLSLDQPILNIDPNKLRTRIEALPWVATASVERQLPDIIHIKLNEHRPTAMWQHDGTFSLINKEGEVILTGGDDIKVFSHLPLVVGKGAPAHADKVLAILRSEPDLGKKVKAAVRVSERRWDIAMENGMFIRLPEDHPEKAWSRLAIYNKEHELFKKKLESVDMRLPDRILVKTEGLETIRKPLVGQDT
ncbi:putative Cell division protein FtsQ [Candidatus Terasakiella magnetica]|uniref:Cell division protein FtsQ n=1 Tax=Candidatus Terasakiella magnetica TaxID=1867952 RepID=A0A1C3RJG2_9PROT|nr:cell division protein FtsQ/DivIB [Candidatus Terasakiella magnetica]SCA57406.1 putative Cell division protein FtsQ [Candidatus Terasakiella magnetica]